MSDSDDLTPKRPRLGPPVTHTRAHSHHPALPAERVQQLQVRPSMVARSATALGIGITPRAAAMTTTTTTGETRADPSAAGDVRVPHENVSMHASDLTTRGDDNDEDTSETIPAPSDFPSDFSEYKDTSAMPPLAESDACSAHRDRNRHGPSTAGTQSLLFDTLTTTDEEPYPFSRTEQDAGVGAGLGVGTNSGPAPDTGPHRRRLHQFSVYETETRFYIVGGDVSDQTFRVLTVHRDSPPGQLTISEDGSIYSKSEMNSFLGTLDAGNACRGGIRLRCSAWGLLGFVRFTASFYMFLITKRTQVALMGGHMIYQVDGTELVPIVTEAEAQRLHKDRTPHESRYLAILGSLNLNQNFYFSYAYNITQTLQNNLAFLRSSSAAASPSSLNDELDPTLPSSMAGHNLNDMFVWNHHLLEPVKQIMENPLDWFVPLIHGFVGQTGFNVMGRRIYVTVMARRSRLYAGARFLKRGVNDAGFVANDVETEQIVSDMLTTSLHSVDGKLYGNGRYTAYVQHRGSIPLFWSQDNSGGSPKPGIKLDVVDPFYQAAALHFDNLFERYGSPVHVLNLVKSRERVPRESILLHEYDAAIRYLNQSLPEDNKIGYTAFDMSRASKTRGQNVVETLEKIAEEVVDKTGFFHNAAGGSDSLEDPSRLQNGVCRTNCIDCLDRTNAAQFVIAKCALGRQLAALGIVRKSTLEYETDAINIFSHMFHDHGDTVATQYGGSYLVNTMATYRKLNQWQSSGRDMVESFKRYYNNSFTDAQRQKAYNLFLGNYVYMPGQPMLWELPTDYYLHHGRLMDDAEGSGSVGEVDILGRRRRHYIHWYTPRFLVPRSMDPAQARHRRRRRHAGYLDSTNSPTSDYWDEYYRPTVLSTLAKVYAFRIGTHDRYTRSVLQSSYSDTPTTAAAGLSSRSNRKSRRSTGPGLADSDPRMGPSRSRRSGQVIYSPFRVYGQPATGGTASATPTPSSSSSLTVKPKPVEKVRTVRSRMSGEFVAPLWSLSSCRPRSSRRTSGNVAPSSRVEFDQTNAGGPSRSQNFPQSHSAAADATATTVDPTPDAENSHSTGTDARPEAHLPANHDSAATTDKESSNSSTTVRPAHERSTSITTTTARRHDRTRMHTWSLTDFYHTSLNPFVSDAERAEYEEYIRFPVNGATAVVDGWTDRLIRREDNHGDDDNDGDSDSTSDGKADTRKQWPSEAEVAELIAQTRRPNGSGRLSDYATYLRMAAMQVQPLGSAARGSKPGKRAGGGSTTVRNRRWRRRPRRRLTGAYSQSHSRAHRLDRSSEPGWSAASTTLPDSNPSDRATTRLPLITSFPPRRGTNSDNNNNTDATVAENNDKGSGNIDDGPDGHGSLSANDVDGGDGGDKAADNDETDVDETDAPKSAYDVLTSTDPDQVTMQHYHDFVGLPLGSTTPTTTTATTMAMAMAPADAIASAVRDFDTAFAARTGRFDRMFTSEFTSAFGPGTAKRISGSSRLVSARFDGSKGRGGGGGMPWSASTTVVAGDGGGYDSDDDDDSDDAGDDGDGVTSASGSPGMEPFPDLVVADR